MVKLSHYKHN